MCDSRTTSKESFDNCVQTQCKENIVDGEYDDPYSRLNLQGRVVKTDRGTHCFNDAEESNGTAETDHLRMFRRWVTTNGYDAQSTLPVGKADNPEDWAKSAVPRDIDELMNKYRTEEEYTYAEIADDFESLKKHISSFDLFAIRFFMYRKMYSTGLEYFDIAIEYADNDAFPGTLHFDVLCVLASVGLKERAAEYFKETFHLYGDRFDLVQICRLGEIMPREGNILFNHQLPMHHHERSAQDVYTMHQFGMHREAIALMNHTDELGRRQELCSF